MADVLSSSPADTVFVGATANFATIVLSKSVDATLSADVQLVADRGGASVEPVGVVRGELTSRGGLDPLCPLNES